MTTPSWDDLDDFLDGDDFAVEATVTPQGGPVRYVIGIYDDKYLNAFSGEYELDTSKPRFECKLSDVIGLRRGTVVSIPGEGTFALLTEPQADGTGMAKLELARDAGP